MNYIKISKCDIANGSGIRVTLWCSGCTLNCKGCHNPESHDFNAGQPFDENAMRELLDALKRPYIAGLTLSGGNPLELKNLSCIYHICETVKRELPSKSIWLYTGHTLTDDIFDRNVDSTNSASSVKSILSLCDVVVDGRYIEELRDITLKFRGSSNQRLIDIKRSIDEGGVAIIGEGDDE